ncbi:thiamin ABC transporter, substrate-binding component [Halarchaeum acidiphilum MH1-52-1]|uniref:Thiamin ABC transporter, substrate-binding component n=1 Tax=Halarchaeum acidiphilum MH1-52-1 TaxID=1261545 RepID=U2YUW3_9EURY|nr:thiamine ABC transporter substrate-binding protein [Halarchaeum acidiphilum]GAD52567.1 thiamin ABC transporter, substrate-binding component [Halarchaeum acidiphilum MH1-52-1]
MKRRDYLRAAGATGAFALAGCTGDGESGSDGTVTTSATNATSGTASGSRTLTVATYPTYVGDESSPGAWLKEHFETAHDGVTVEWTTPSTGSSSINEYVQRAKQGASIDADVYVGLNTDELVRVDRELDDRLFANVGDDLSHAGDVKDELSIDPRGRALPYDTGYITPVVDATTLDVVPETFDDLLASRYRGDLLMENAQSADTGKAFLLHTIHEKGADGYLDYWRDLLDNDVRVLDTWKAAYNAYTKGEAPMVVSYSNDQVYAANEGEDLEKYEIAFLNDEGYANPESAAVFADSDVPDLARAFVDFMLSPDAQDVIPQRNYEFPATTTGSLSGSYAKYAQTPPTPVTFTYDELAGNVTEWIEQWARLVASH